MENVYTGTDVSIGANCLLLSTRAQIKIGDYVMFGLERFSYKWETIALMLSGKECMRLKIPKNVKLMIRM